MSTAVKKRFTVNGSEISVLTEMDCQVRLNEMKRCLTTSSDEEWYTRFSGYFTKYKYLTIPQVDTIDNIIAKGGGTVPALLQPKLEAVSNVLPAKPGRTPVVNRHSRGYWKDSRIVKAIRESGETQLWKVCKRPEPQFSRAAKAAYNRILRENNQKLQKKVDEALAANAKQEAHFAPKYSGWATERRLVLAYFGVTFSVVGIFYLVTTYLNLP